ncbi:MAG: hypothetical protein MAG453_02001 [Calditrichaeota bacterium]|nr:hypothetical protein [Calditrichota bacterium]
MAQREQRHTFAGILLLLGAVLITAESRAISWYDVGDLLQWWPALLLALGVWLLVRPRERKEPESISSGLSETSREKMETGGKPSDE